MMFYPFRLRRITIQFHGNQVLLIIIYAIKKGLHSFSNGVSFEERASKAGSWEASRAMYNEHNSIK